MITKPLLAVECDPEKIVFPVLVSPKLDGIRCLFREGKILSRSFKPIPNRFVRECLETNLSGFDGLDGELVLQHTKNFQEITSAIMSHDGEPNFVYSVFDHVHTDLNEEFVDRLARACDIVLRLKERLGDKISFVHHMAIFNLEELAEYESKAVANGYEGIMLRKMDGKYKCGRSTLNEGILLKMKRFEDSEAEIIGFEEKLHNNNEKTIDNLGHTKRSSHKENKVGAGTLGKFLVVDINSKIEFKIGTGIGLGDSLRQEIWDNQDKYKGKLIKYKYQPFGVKVAPRIPVFLGFRDERDM